jgi:hypothetical protein
VRIRFPPGTLATALFALIVAFQIFGPKPIGLADNNDFPKVLGTWGVWAKPEFQADRFKFFVTDYRIDPGYIWDSQLPSSEVWIAGAALKVNQLILPAGQFDMRTLGGIHALLATLAVWLFLIPLGTWPLPRRIAFTGLILLVFADVEYVQFFSTAYMDAASLIILMLVVAAAWNEVLQEGRASWRWAVFFAVCALALIGTKPQHAPTAIPLALFSLLAARRARERLSRTLWLITPAALLLAAWSMVLRVPAGAIVESEFSLVFSKLLPLSKEPASVLSELGRPSSDLAYNHMHAYSPGSPLGDPVYRAAFGRDITTAGLLLFYLRHPATAFQISRSDFQLYAPDLPLGNFGTMRRADYPEPVYRAKGLRIWSTLRSQSCLRWPWHILLLYVVAFCIALLRLGRPMGPLLITVSAIGVLSFITGSLGDATETSRHIALYQEATDMVLILFAFHCLRPATKACFTS